MPKLIDTIRSITDDEILEVAFGYSNCKKIQPPIRLMTFEEAMPYLVTEYKAKDNSKLPSIVLWTSDKVIAISFTKHSFVHGIERITECQKKLT